MSYGVLRFITAETKSIGFSCNESDDGDRH
jgi:hypothetical protein